MSVKSEKIPCTGKTPICVRKKHKSGKTSEYDCNGEILNVGKRLNHTYGLQWNEGKDVEKEFGGICSENGEQNDDDCFCNTGDYAWLTYIGEAKRRLDILERTIKDQMEGKKFDKEDLSKEEKKKLKDEIDTIFKEAKDSKTMPFDFIAIIKDIIEIAKKRWKLNDNNDIIRKLYTILEIFEKVMNSYYNENDSEEVELNSSSIILPETKKLIFDKFNNGKISKEDINNLIEGYEKKFIKIIHTYSIDMILKVIVIAHDIFEIGLYIMQKELDKFDIKSILERLQNNINNIVGTEKVSVGDVKGGRKSKKLIKKHRKSKKFIYKKKLYKKKSKYLKKGHKNTYKKIGGGLSIIDEWTCYQKILEKNKGFVKIFPTSYSLDQNEDVEVDDLFIYLKQAQSELEVFFEYLLYKSEELKLGFFSKCLLSIGISILVTRNFAAHFAASVGGLGFVPLTYVTTGIIGLTSIATDFIFKLMLGVYTNKPTPGYICTTDLDQAFIDSIKRS